MGQWPISASREKELGFMEPFFGQIFCDIDRNYSVIIEDNGRVCYAYLLYNQDIIADVWLYNSKETPKDVDWTSKRDLPFMNPSEYVDPNKSIEVINDEADMKIEWINSDYGLELVNIFIRHKLIARMKPGCKPGWSTLVSKDGPLAKILY